MIFCSAFLLSLSLLTAGAGGSSFVSQDTPPNANVTLHRITDSETSTTPVFTTQIRQGDSVTLTPVYPLSPGETYEARVTTDGKISERLTYHHPAPEIGPPKVVKILPSTKEVPANLLKFYIEFDQPMREGREIFERIHIVDENGKQVYSPWRRQELWSNDSTRLTLWIHPGRIKQGVNLRQQLGPVLLPGKKYTLLLDSSIQSPAGKNLGKSFRHSFSTTTEYRQLLAPSTWKVSPPKPERDSLLIETPKSLDPYLASRHLTVSKNGNPVNTTLKWNQSQTKFWLSAETPWTSGNYRIEIGEFLEDLAGNTVLRIFDTDLTLPPSKPSTLVREFEIK